MADVQINPTTSDYEMDIDGLLVATNELTQAAYIRLRAHFGEWLYDPFLGSTLFALDEKADGRGKDEVLRRAERALQPIIDDGRASEIVVTLRERTRYGRAINVAIKDARTDEVSTLPFFVPVP